MIGLKATAISGKKLDFCEHFFKSSSAPINKSQKYRYYSPQKARYRVYLVCGIFLKIISDPLVV